MKILIEPWQVDMRKLEAKNLYMCPKCGNVMVNRILKRDSNPNSGKVDKILQCIVCKHWVSAD
jgi:hypothetical protein